MVLPSPASSMKASPSLENFVAPLTDLRLMDGVFLDKERTISKKHMSHSSGPMVDPWPGPKRKYSREFWYNSSDMPYIVLMWCVMFAHVPASDLRTSAGTPNFRKNIITSGFTILS
jgi:hypothetical protein